MDAVFFSFDDIDLDVLYVPQHFIVFGHRGIEADLVTNVVDVRRFDHSWNLTRKPLFSHPNIDVDGPLRYNFVELELVNHYVGLVDRFSRRSEPRKARLLAGRMYQECSTAVYNPLD